MQTQLQELKKVNQSSIQRATWNMQTLSSLDQHEREKLIQLSVEAGMPVPVAATPTRNISTTAPASRKPQPRQSIPDSLVRTNSRIADINTSNAKKSSIQASIIVRVFPSCTEIRVSDTSRCVIGMKAVIGPAPRREYGFVLGITDATIQIAPPLSMMHTAGEPIWFTLADAKQVMYRGNRHLTCTHSSSRHSE